MADPATAIGVLPLAHVGHWTTWILYALPVIAVAIAIVRGAKPPVARPGETDPEGEGEVEPERRDAEKRG